MYLELRFKASYQFHIYVPSCVHDKQITGFCLRSSTLLASLMSRQYSSQCRTYSSLVFMHI